jgi:hypothetical protein
MVCKHSVVLNVECMCCAEPVRLVNSLKKEIMWKHRLVIAGNQISLILQTGVPGTNEHIIIYSYVTGT